MPLDPNQLKEIILSTTHGDLLAEILYSNILHKDNEIAIISAINSLLANAKTRVRGLELINLIIPYCSLGVLSEHAIKWVNHCMVHHQTENTKIVKLKVLTKIIECTSGSEIFKKKFLTGYLSDTFKTCLSSHGRGLKCLTQCMQQYGSWFGNHRQQVEPFLFQFLENNTEHTKEAADAFHYFQQTGSAGLEGINHIKNYSTQFNKLCATVYSLYDSFFENIEEVNKTDPIELEPFKFSPIPPNLDSVKTLEVIFSRIINCLTFMEAMIVKTFPTVKSFVLKYVVDIIIRGSSTHVCLSSEINVSEETNTLSLLLNKIQIKLLNLLGTLMEGHLPTLLIFSDLITKVLLNNVKRIQNCSCFTTDLHYQESSYTTIRQWLLLTKIGYQPHLQEALIPLLLDDVAPVRKKVLLNLHVSGKGKLKKKQKAMASQNTQSEVDEVKLYTVGNLLKEARCCYALDILRCILSTTHIINQHYLLNLLEFNVKTLVDVQNGRTVCPYTNIQCQIKLYEVLIATLKQDEIIVTPPLHTINAILEKGSNNTNYSISQTCREGLHLVQKISQPVISPFFMYNFDIESIKVQIIKEIKNTENREALNMDVDETDENEENQNVQVPEHEKASNNKSENNTEREDTNGVVKQSNGINKSESQNEEGNDTINQSNVALKTEVEILSTVLLTSDEEFGEEKRNTFSKNQSGLEENRNLSTVKEGITLNNETKGDEHSDNIEVSTEPMTTENLDLEEPPAKKKKEDDVTVEEMLASFVDVFQD